jgi:hypothetical protein
MSLHTPTREDLLNAVLIGVGAAFPTAATAFIYATFIEPNWIELCEVSLTLPRLDAQFDGYRIVHISDIHAGKWMPQDRLDRIVEMVNEQQPDLIAVTGDFVTRTYRKAPVDIAPTMRKLQAKDGVVAVLGNHDYWGGRGPGQMRRVIRLSRMIDLNNKVHILERDGALLSIAGVDSARARKARLDLALRDLPDEGCAILLAHEPDFADKSARTGRFDLQISGHSHGGQVRLPVLPPPRLPPMGRKYHTGLYRVGDMIQYTNRGLGVVGLPFRFWSRPEITVFTLQSLH